MQGIWARVSGAVREAALVLLRRGWWSLGGRLVVLTVFFVMLVEVMVYVPSVSFQRDRLLMARLELAQLAALTVETSVDKTVEVSMRRELLDTAGVLTVTLKRDQSRALMLSVTDPPQIDARIDLGSEWVGEKIRSTFSILGSRKNRILYVRGMPVKNAGFSIEFAMEEVMLRKELLRHSWNIFYLSLLISVATAALVWLSLHLSILRPIRRITSSMALFADRPTDASRMIAASENEKSEIGEAERALATLQRQVLSALQQKSRLAALGTAVSKINHDLRNILASSQLVGERLAQSEDPVVQRLAPKFVASLDRAIALATNTLKYGRAEEPPPEPRPLPLRTLVEDVRQSLETSEGLAITVENEIAADMEIVADPDQIFRVLLNLARNAVQALEAEAVEDKPGRIVFTGETDETEWRLQVRDNGPGIPAEARERLFEAFISAARQGGTGLGLAIAAELVEAHGGTLSLKRSDASGTVFEICLPRP